ncbi:S41 family peptidase [Capnocytophaga stomatis]|uniref:S41 family peptidase n=1 Tax=Capnocytophaga stomatis TaxID=1848904 RepID=UPI0038586728
MKRIFLSILLMASILSCKKDVDDTPKPDDVKNEDVLNLEIKDFIWKGLNTFYLWQADVPNLADTRFAPSVQQTNFANTAYSDFLKSYKTPDELFFNLLNKPEKIYKKEAIDRFSYITNDYTELERSFQGVSLSTGMEFGLTRYGQEGGVLGFVNYVLPNSEAEQKGVKRGDLFLTVDGTPLTVSNYKSLLFNDKTSMAIDIYRLENVNGQKTIQKTNKSVVMAKKEITENPILIKKVIEKGTHKIGYLMYNGFVANFDKQLNEAFGEFKSQGITDFVLDLRYNGGGRVSSATYLASMITGQFNGQIFAKERWNSKLQPIVEKERGGVDNFFTNEMTTDNKEKIAINSLNLSKIYILTSGRTASASELVINGLRAYIDVVQIGDVTVGKNQGSITIYDWIDNNRNKNPKHKWAMQPLVLKIENAKGEGDYTSGLRPTFQMEEDLTNYGVLGDEKEPLLAKAIQSITGATDKRLPSKPEMPTREFVHSKSFNFAANEMYK